MKHLSPLDFGVDAHYDGTTWTTLYIVPARYTGLNFTLTRRYKPAESDYEDALRDAFRHLAWAGICYVKGYTAPGEDF